MDDRTLAYYDAHAAEVARRYESADAGKIRANLVRAFPPGGRLLELGCGSGRDAAFLLSQGYSVTAVDASPAMLAEAVRLHPELKQHLLLHALPDPLPFGDGEFDGVYSVALLMHLDKETLTPAFREIARVVRPGGRFLFSIPDLRKDPIVNERDPHGRLFTFLDEDDWVARATASGLALVEKMLDPDCLGRSGFTWHTFLFGRLP